MPLDALPPEDAGPIEAELLVERLARDLDVDLDADTIVLSIEAFTIACSRAWLAGATVAINRVCGVRTCNICGCCQDSACDGGCSWASDSLCTACAPATVS
ncbi:MAG: hypothetical protein KBC34_01070 [Phenylobacterium sp.]|nr:hypothetical protein [Phenylobacterium sp.]